MSSPFSFFRKHSKALMAVLTFMAMFAFIVMDYLKQDGVPVVFGMLTGGVLFGLAAYLTKAKKKLPLAFAGTVLGGVVAFAAMGRLSPPSAAVSTSVGSLTDHELALRVQQRQVINRFLELAFGHSRDPEQYMGSPPQFGFRGPQSLQEVEQDVVFAYILQHEADRMGIKISDDAVNAFLNDRMNGRLTDAIFKQVRTEMNLTTSQVFDLIRNELKATMAMRMLSPATVPTPEQYWDIFRRLNVKEQLDDAAVPLSVFASSVPDPSTSEMTTFFEKYKNSAPHESGAGEPGFYQPRKVKLAYLEADAQAIEAKVPKVTDQEIVDFYNSNKELYRNRRVPAQKDTKPPAANPVEAPKGSSTDSSSKEVPKSGKEVTTHYGPEDTKAASEAKKADETKTPASPDASAASSKTDAKAKPPENAKASEDAKPAGDTKAAAGTPAPATTKAAEASKTAAPAATTPTITPKKPDAPLPEFRPLDDALKGEIREQLLRQRTQAALKQVIDEGAMDLMSKLREEKVSPANEGPKLTAQHVSERMKKYAEEHGLRYVSTALLSVSELSDSAKYPVADAIEPSEDPFQRNRATTVLMQLFQTPAEVLYSPYIAEDSLSGNRFAYWKTEDVEGHIPTLDQPGIKQQVVDAWKLVHARPKAEKRAEQLAEIVRKGDKPMAEALAGQTVTGAKESEPLKVQQSASFSWLRESSAPTANPFMKQPPELSSINTIDGADDGFMRTVFDQLKDGEVGVAPNADRSIVYVVKVKNRKPATADEQEVLHRVFLASDVHFFLSPIYQLMRQEQQQQNYEWSVALEKKYDVKWNPKHMERRS